MPVAFRYSLFKPPSMEPDTLTSLLQSQCCKSCGLSTLNSNLSTPALPKLYEYLSQHPGNHLAPDDELPVLKGYLSSAESEARQYDREIERLTNILGELKTKRTSITQVISRFSATFRPSVRKLPVEILSRIFLTYSDEHLETSTEHSREHVGLTLGRVCSRWRTIVYSTPRLWCIMNASDLHVNDDRSQQNLHLTSLCIERSQNMPLEIWFRSCPKALDSSFLELLKHSGRWRVAVLDDWVSLYGRIFPVDLPLLESLSLSVSSNSPGIFSLGERFPQNVSTPRLRHLSLNGRLTTLGPRFDTSSLTTFFIQGGVQYPLFLDTLKQSPMLSKLKLSGVTFLDREPIDSPPVSLPHLKEFLSDTFDEESNLPYFLQDIVAPRLEYVSMFVERWRNVIDTPTTLAFGNFLNKSASPYLTRLRFIQTNFEELRDCFDILELVSPTITSLELWCNHNSLQWDEFLRRVTVDPDFLPKLQELTFLFGRWSDDSESLLYDMVESRRNSKVPEERLSKLRAVCTKDEVKDAICERLAPFEAEDFRLLLS